MESKSVSRLAPKSQNFKISKLITVWNQNPLVGLTPPFQNPLVGLTIRSAIENYPLEVISRPFGHFEKVRLCECPGILSLTNGLLPV